MKEAHVVTVFQMPLFSYRLLLPNLEQRLQFFGLNLSRVFGEYCLGSFLDSDPYSSDRFPRSWSFPKFCLFMYACTYLFTSLACVCMSECVFVCERACVCV